ncbi:MAG: hypothetical protein QF805_18025 [Pirellulaceae bacterium]|nr:hypothetical protein [Pirellulaceae bacterium]
MNHFRSITLLTALLLSARAAGQQTSRQDNPLRVPLLLAQEGLFDLQPPAADNAQRQVEPPTTEPPKADAPKKETVCPTAKEVAEAVRKFSDITLNIKPEAKELPEDCATNLFSPQGDPTMMRAWALVEYHWEPSEFFHQPLYFDDQPLERYGQSMAPRLQPLISGAHFFGNFFVTPYKMGVNRTHDRISTLGYYRAGSYAPCVRQRIPFELQGMSFETAAALGLIFILP